MTRSARRAKMVRRVLLPLALLGLGAGAGRATLDNGVARTPPMGWNSWNHFGCDVSAQLIRETADAMAANGMRDAGYQYVVIDDCWQVARDAQGRLVADTARFPGGIKPLADYVHARGLKFGIYTDAGRKTCQGRPGTYGHEVEDARTFAAWGVDYVKEDWCYADSLDAPIQYAKFRDALRGAGRPIVYSICEWGSFSPWDWGPTTGHLWRTTTDIEDKWSSMLDNLDISGQHAAAARPGAWNDPDMLEVGNGGMTDAEYRAHFSLWAIMAAPLIAGNDVRAMNDATRAILTATEVIAVDQDRLGRQGRRVRQDRDVEVWARELDGGARAAVLLNRGDIAARAEVTWDLLGGSRTDTALVRDLWERQDIGPRREGYDLTLAPHSAALLKATRDNSAR